MILNHVCLMVLYTLMPNKRDADVKLILPIKVTLPRKTVKDKNFILNLNTYRNTHHMILNESKHKFHAVIKKLINQAFAHIRRMKKVRLVYTYYHGSNRRVDIANVCSIIDKFTCDALSSENVWRDDDYKTVTEVIYKWGGVDKANPRCELDIIRLD